jgi:glycosyltransferase involved in cell wall biosynthesis
VYDPNAVAYFRQHGRNTSVSAFNSPPYYAEHERLMTLLRKQWGVPDYTIEKFYYKVSEQYRHFNMMARFGPLSQFVNKDKLLRIGREKPHILIAFLGFHVGGGEVFPINLANALHGHGHTVSMMALDTTKVNAGMLASLNPGIPVYDSRHVETMGPDEFLADAGVSIIHSHMLSVDMFFFNKMRMRRKIPYLVSLHGSYEAIPIDDGSLLRIIKGVSHWVYTAEKNLDTFKSVPLKSEMFSKLGNAMPFDPQPFAQTRDELGIAQDAVVFTFVARGVKQKGWPESIRAFIRLRDENPGRKMHLLLCGEGEEANRLAQSHAKDPNITFLGYQSRISGLYRISDCAIVPTRFIGESFPLCIIQAMQVGTPIIATKIGEIEAMVARPGRVAGILIENENIDDAFVKSLKAAMQVMLEESARTDFAKAAKLNGSEYNIDIIADKYYSIYKQLIWNDKSRI